MKLLLVNQHFHPDVAATAQLLSDLAVDLAAAGAEVTALASDHAYAGGERWPRLETWRGVRILRVPSTRFGKATLPGRAADAASFLAACGAASLVPREVDVTVTLSSPPMLASLGAMGSTLRSLRGRSRFLCWVQDVYPDIAVRLGALRAGGAVARGLEATSRVSLRAADAVVAIGDDMAERLRAKGADPRRLHVIPNWSDGDALGTVAVEDNAFLDAHGLRGKFVVLYSGNMGLAHDFGATLAAARALRDDPRIVFVFIGDGAARERLVRETAGLPSVRFLPYQRREDLPLSFGAADVCLVTLREDMAGLVVPSKLYSAMAARKAALFVGPMESDAARTILEERCGAVHANGDAMGVVETLRRMADAPGEARGMGERGREAYERRFARRVATGRFLALCEALYREESRSRFERSHG